MIPSHRFVLLFQACFVLLLSFSLLQTAAYAEPAVKTIGKYAKDRFVGWEDDTTLIRYGNWFGPGWWGGSELDNRVGMMPPIDSLDAVAQKHDFGYMLAEKLGEGRPDVEAYYKAQADFIAARDAMALSDDPSKWPLPASNPDLAKTYLERIKFGFPNFQQKLNELKSMMPHRADITNPNTLNQMLDGDPDDKQFEAMMDAEVKSWRKKYDVIQQKANKAKTAEEKEAARLVVAQSTPKDIMERLQKLNHNKLIAALNGLQISPPLNFYHCLCKSAAYGGSQTSQLYHPDTIGEYNRKYSCNQPGDPCVVAGAGCTRHPLPSKPEIWESCTDRHRLNMATDANGKDIPGSGERLDDAIKRKLRERGQKR